MDVSIIIVSYNTADLTMKCLKSLYAETQGVDFEVIVVDNASTDDSAERIQAEFDQVKLTALTENIGFARGVNLAAESAAGTYILLLNPDTVVHDGAVQRLVSFARKNPQHGIYGGRTLAPSGSVDPSSCWGVPTLWSLFCFATGLSSAFRRSSVFDPESLGGWQRDSVRQVGFVTGCLCLVERALWERLGGFDSRYFMYGEDADLGMRAADLGFQPVITPEATITHVVGASSSSSANKKVMVMKGKSTLLKSHFHGWEGRAALALLQAGVAVRAAGGRLRKRTATSGWSEVWARRSDWVDGYPEA